MEGRKLDGVCAEGGGKLKPYPSDINEDIKSVTEALRYICRTRCEDISDFDNLTSRFISGDVNAARTNTSVANINDYLKSATASSTYLTKTDAATLYALPSQTGNNGKFLTTNGTTPSWATVTQSFTKSFVGSDITVSTGSQVYAAQAHGLGAVPNLMQLVLRCTSANLNYVQNDEVLVQSPIYNGANLRNLMPVADATNMQVIQANAIAVLNKTTSAVADINYNNWVLVMRAWA